MKQNCHLFCLLSSFTLLIIIMVIWPIKGARAVVAQQATPTPTPMPIPAIPPPLPTIPPDIFGPLGSPDCGGCMVASQELRQILESAVEAQRVTALPIPPEGFEPNSTVRVALIYLNPTKNIVKGVPVAELQADANGNLPVNQGTIATYAPTGDYVVAAYDVNTGYSIESIIEDITQPGISVNTFRLDNRTENLTVAVDTLPGNQAVRYLDAAWKDPLASPQDKVEIVWSRNGQEFSHFANGFLSESVSLFQFLDRERQGTELYEPALGTVFTPGLPRIVPNLAYPSLEAGEYRVDIYLNGVKEASETVIVESQ